MLTPEQQAVLGKLVYFTTFLALVLPIVEVLKFYELPGSGLNLRFDFKSLQVLSP